MLQPEACIVPHTVGHISSGVAQSARTIGFLTFVFRTEEALPGVDRSRRRSARDATSSRILVLAASKDGFRRKLDSAGLLLNLEDEISAGSEDDVLRASRVRTFKGGGALHDPLRRPGQSDRQQGHKRLIIDIPI